MKKILIFLLLLLLFPSLSSASCNKNGTTIIFINGIFGDEKYVKSDIEQLNFEFEHRSEFNDIEIIGGYNASHGDGSLDLSSAIIQAYNGGYVDYDLTNILRQIHGNLKTQKIILVGHSQGAFYTNVAYDYLVNHGVDKSAISVYAIGTPADYVAGGGKYLTSSTDEVINKVVAWLTKVGSAKQPLSSNITIDIPNEPGVDYAMGHSFSQVYLGLKPERIVNDIDKEIKELSAINDKEECFIQPEKNILYNVSAFGYKIVDDFGELGQHPEYMITGVPQSLQAGFHSLLQKSYELGKSIFSNISRLFQNNNLFGASLVSIPLNGDNNGQINDIENDENSGDSSEVSDDLNGTGGYDDDYTPQMSLQDWLDGIQESLDIINQKVQELVNQQNQGNEDEGRDDKEENEEVIDNSNENDNTSDNEDNNWSNGGGSVAYPKILISEIQASPIDNRFIELYNPNDFAVSLTGWYMQRKDKNDTSWGSFVSSTNFEGKAIIAHGYLLISRQLSSSDILANITIGADNSIALKNPNGEISDKLGFGQAIDPELIATDNPLENRSIGRKVLIGGDLVETNNNFNDFEAGLATPKAQNIKYIVSSQKVLISEIQIDGIEGIGGTNEDYVELYNPNDFAVSLMGWSIQKHSSSNPCSTTSSFKIINFPDNATVPAKGYYLIVKHSATQELLNKANLISSSLQLHEGNTIYLVRGQSNITTGEDSSIMDKVGFGESCFAETSPAVNPPESKSIGRKILVDFTEQDTDVNSEDFEVNVPTPNLQNRKYIISDPIDITAPQVSFNLNSTQNNLNFSVNFNITDPLVGTVSPSGIKSYVFRWQEDGGEWKNDETVILIKNSVSDNFSREFEGQEGKIYGFQVKATDILENESLWLPELPVTTEIKLIPKVLINEIKVSGETANDEFIELYNPNNFDIDLADYSLKKKISNGTESLLVSADKFSGTIPGFGYFLITPQTGYTGTATPDLYYSGVSYSLTDNNTVILYNKEGEVLSKVGYGQAIDYETLPAVAPLSKQSIQRKWDTINDKAQDTGNNSADFYIFSSTTPKAQSPKYILYNGYTFSENITLKNLNIPYLFKGTNYISPEIKMIIEPGAVLKFADSVLIVDGNLTAIGNKDNIIAFTSVNDIEYGGDIRVEGNNTPVSAGQWSGILFNQTSVGSDLENVVIRYAGGNIARYLGGAIKVDRTSIILKNSFIQNNLNSGVYLFKSDSLVDNVELSGNNNTSFDIYNGKGVYIDGGIGAQVKNCTFKDNYDALFLTNGSGINIYPVIYDNYFENNHNAINIDGNDIYPNLSGNSVKDNYCNATILSVSPEEDFTIKKDLTYLIKKAITVPNGVTLTVEAGTVLKFADSILNINGTLSAIGVAGQPIVFTSVDDREYGEDVWPGNTTPVAPGQWSGILFSESSVNSNLENAIIRYGGGNLGGYVGGGIGVRQSAIKLKNSIIQNNKLSGLQMINSLSEIDSVEFLGNASTESGINFNGIFVLGGAPTVKNSYLAENNYGVYMDSWNGIKPNPFLENLTFGPLVDPLDPAGKAYGPNTVKDVHDDSLPPESAPLIENINILKEGEEVILSIIE